MSSSEPDPTWPAPAAPGSTTPEPAEPAPAETATRGSVPRWAVWAGAAVAGVVVLVGWSVAQVFGAAGGGFGSGFGVGFGPDPDDVVAAFAAVLETSPDITVTMEGHLPALASIALAEAAFPAELVDHATVARWSAAYPALSWELTTGEDGWTRTTLLFDQRAVTTVATPPSEQDVTVVGFGIDPLGYARLASALTGREVLPEEVGQRLLGTPAAAAVANPYLDPSALDLVWIEVDPEDADRVTGAALLPVTELATLLDSVTFEAGARSGRSTSALGPLGVDDATRVAAMRLLTGVGMESLLLLGDGLPSSSVPALPLPADIGAAEAGPMFELDVLDYETDDERVIQPHAHLRLVDVASFGSDADVAALLESVPVPLTWTITAQARVFPRALASTNGPAGPPAGAVVLGADALEQSAWVATRTDQPDEVSMDDLVFMADGLGREMEAQRLADGSYPRFTSDVIERAAVVLDPWYPRSLAGWVVRLGGRAETDACFEALHDEGWLWSMRASTQWEPSPGGC